MKSNLSDRICVFLFLVLLIMPMSGIFGETDVQNFKIIEQRDPYKFPYFSGNLKKYFKSLELYLNDNVALRFTAIKFLNKIYLAFNESPKPDLVIVGKNRWLFLANNNSETLDQYRKLDYNNRDDVVTNINYFSKIEKYLKKEKKRLVVLIVPNKHSIYFENLPDWANNKINIKSKYDLLIEGLIKNSIKTIDTKYLLLNQKNKNTILYFPGGTHWNSLGAFYAFQAIFDILEPKNKDIKKFKNPDITINGQKGDNTLYNWLQYPIQYYKTDEIPWYSEFKNNKVIVYSDGEKPTEKTILTNIRVNNGMPPIVVRNINAKSQSKILFIRDSFGNALSPYLHVAFSETIHIRHSELGRYSTLSKLVKIYNPDVVLFEIVERLTRRKFSVKNDL